MGLRVERQCENALELAQYLQSLDAGISVNYPGLPDNPYYELAKRQFGTHFGAIVTMRAGSKERAFRIINALKLPFILSNIGDTKTLVLHPASTIAVHLSQEEQLQSGVYEDLIRISVGIEDIEDLKADFKQALEQA
jgi:O-acetylhomoserine (thiol)-lyase